MNVTLSPCKAKGYEGLFVYVPWLEISHFLNERAGNDKHYLKIGFCDDNRLRFKQLWGKPHFYFRSWSWNYHHVWRFKVEHEGRTEYYFVFTAKDKGTSIERTAPTREHECLPDPTVFAEIDKQFALWYESELQKSCLTIQ